MPNSFILILQVIVAPVHIARDSRGSHVSSETCTTRTYHQRRVRLARLIRDVLAMRGVRLAHLIREMYIGPHISKFFKQFLL